MLAEGRFVIALLVVICATVLYGLGMVTDMTNPQPIEPQSLFTLYGAVLGYLFGTHDRDLRRQTKNKTEEERIPHL